MESRLVGTFGAWVFAVCLSTNAFAGSLNISFTKVVDTSTAVPGGSGTFSSFGSEISIDNGNIAFRANDSASNDGVYARIGENLSVIANTNTVIPNSAFNGGAPGRTYRDFGSPSISGNDVAFWGLTPTNPVQQGIYKGNAGTVNVVADGTTAIPGGSGTFVTLNPSNGLPLLVNGDTAFVGWDATFAPGGQMGVYTSIGGSLNLIANVDTPIPGGTGNFGFPGPAGGGTVAFSSAAFDGQNVVFLGRGTGQEGIYTNTSGSLTAVADKNTLIPGGSGFFTNLSSRATIDGGMVAFSGSGSFGRGIYKSTGGALEVVADLTTVIPDLNKAFANFNSPVIDGSNIMFGGVSSATGFRGIAADFNGTLAKIIDSDDMLDGKGISFVSYGPDGFSGNQIAFGVTFDDASKAIYLAEISSVPLPPTLLFFGSGLLGLIGVAKKRKAI